MSNFTLTAWLRATLALLALAGTSEAPAQSQIQSPAQTPAQTPTSRQAAEPLRFAILEFIVSGNTVLPQAKVEEAVYPYLGESQTVADAEGARQALEKAYQEAGFLSVVVDLPPQRVGAAGGDGAVRLNVIEAPVGKLRVTGARYTLPSQIKEQVPSLAPGSVPNFPQMQAELGAVARQSADREITPVVAAGDQPGTMNVELKVQDDLPVHGFVEANSKQAQNTKRGRLEASASYDNLYQHQHSLGANWVYSPVAPAETNIISLTYNLPLGKPGDRLFVTASHSNSDTPTELGGSTITRGETYGLRWRRELRTTGNFQHAFTWGADYHYLRDRNIGIAGFTTTSTASPPLRYPTFSADYDFTQFYDKAGRSTTFDAGVTTGLPGLGERSVDCDGRTVDQFECKRAGASAGFQVLTLGVSHREPLGRDWLLSTRLRTQFASGALVSAEQMTAGGADSVRGYFEGEQAGDMGMQLRAELYTPVFLRLWAIKLKGLGFIDRALLRKLDALPGEPARIQLGSYGLGLRADSSLGFSVNLDWAKPVFDTGKFDATGTLLPLTGQAAGREQRWELSVRQSF